MILKDKASIPYRRIHSLLRSGTSVLFFGFTMALMSILVMLYQGSSNIVAMTDGDLLFIQSDQMKWGIIMVSVILIAGTLIDLYFSLVVRTYYLQLVYYPDIAEEIERMQQVARRVPKNVRSSARAPPTLAT